VNETSLRITCCTVIHVAGNPEIKYDKDDSQPMIQQIILDFNVKASSRSLWLANQTNRELGDSFSSAKKKK
jgi:hypothetical protein